MAAGRRRESRRTEGRPATRLSTRLGRRSHSRLDAVRSRFALAAAPGMPLASWPTKARRRARCESRLPSARQLAVCELVVCFANPTHTFVRPREPAREFGAWRSSACGGMARRAFLEAIAQSTVVALGADRTGGEIAMTGLAFWIAGQLKRRRQERRTCCSSLRRTLGARDAGQITQIARGFAIRRASADRGADERMWRRLPGGAARGVKPRGNLAHDRHFEGVETGRRVVEVVVTIIGVGWSGTVHCPTVRVRPGDRLAGFVRTATHRRATGAAWRVG